jgi:hypothetical protein
MAARLRTERDSLSKCVEALISAWGADLAGGAHRAKLDVPAYEVHEAGLRCLSNVKRAVPWTAVRRAGLSCSL